VLKPICRTFMSLLCLYCLAYPAYAVELPDLYQSEVPVSSHSLTARKQAIRTAFLHVLTKVSGNTALATVPAIKKQLGRADNYVQQYSYLREAVSQEMPQKIKYRLQVRFDTRAVNQLLRQSGQAIWGTNRPLIVVWLALSDSQGHRFVGVDNGNEIVQALQQSANQYGLPLFFPLLDLQDLNNLSLNDIFDLNQDMIVRASRRYHADVELIGQLRHDAMGHWTAHWTMLMGNEQFVWDTNGQSLPKNIKTIINDVADVLASRYAVLENRSADKPVFLTVTGIHSVKAYAKVLKYLSRLTPVRRVSIEVVEPDSIQFSLSLSGNMQSLVQAIAFNPMLQPLHTDTIQQDLASMQYRLVR